MEVMICYFLASLLHYGVYSRYVEVCGNTFITILNQNYTEEVVSARSKLECSMFCLHTNLCEAIYYNSTVDNSKCILRKYTTNSLYPLVVDKYLPGNVSILVLHKTEDVWTPTNDYTYNSTLKFWYRAVIDHKANITDANAECKADGAYLMLIRNQADFDFLVNIQRQHDVVRMYLQGTRLRESDGFVDELGRPLPFYQWDDNGISGGGLYLRTDSNYDMDTSSGNADYRYICQVQLN